MYGDRHTSEYIKGVHDFLEVAEANKQNGFMCCPCPICGNTKSYSDRKILHTHLLYKGFMPHYNVWTRHGEIGVMMEDGEEEEDDDNYVPPEYGDAATTSHKTILLVCLSHFEKIMHALNVLGGVSVTVHPLPVHLRALYIIKCVKNHYRTS